MGLWRIISRINLYVLSALFAGGAVGGTLLDQIHVRWNVLSYSDPALLGQAWWVWPQYGIATTLAFFAAIPFVFSVNMDRPVIRDFLWFVIAYLVTAILQKSPLLVTLLLIIIWSARVVSSKYRVRTVTYCLALASIGTAYELALTQLGAFSYHHPNIFGLPIWLPSLYLHAGLFALGVTSTILRSLVREKKICERA
jgi:hypothetical protein